MCNKDLKQIFYEERNLVHNLLDFSFYFAKTNDLQNSVLYNIIYYFRKRFSSFKEIILEFFFFSITTKF